jgi:hypothetical protein
VVKPKQVHTQCCYDVVAVLSQCCYSVCRSVVMVSCTREEGLREEQEGGEACGRAKTGAHTVLLRRCYSVVTVLLQCMSQCCHGKLYMRRGIEKAQEGGVACGQAKTRAHTLLLQCCHSVVRVVLLCCQSVVTVLLQCC